MWIKREEKGKKEEIRGCGLLRVIFLLLLVSASDRKRFNRLWSYSIPLQLQMPFGFVAQNLLGLSRV